MKTKVLEKINVLVLAILAGILIGIGGFVNLYCSIKYDNSILGAVFFSTGLIFICFFGLNLFTGKAAYLIDNKLSYFLNFLIMIVGNFIGVGIVGIIFATCNTLDEEALAEFIAKKISFTETGISWWSLLLMAMLAGALVYLAVEGFKKVDNQVAKLILIALPISIMIIVGGEHSVANGFYYFACIFLIDASGWLVLASLLIAVIGNILGSIILHFLFKIVKKTANLQE